MKITEQARLTQIQLRIYPIKSIRGISVPSSTLTPQGLLHDRRYILLRPLEDGKYGHMFVGDRPEMALFHCSLPDESLEREGSLPKSFIVKYHAPTLPLSSPTASDTTPITIPFSPNTSDKIKIALNMHTSSSYPAWIMDDSINAWFTTHFGYTVVLAFIGDSLGIRKPKTDTIATTWLKEMKTTIPNQVSNIQFSDNAALLITSEASLSDLHPRLGGEKAIHEKFRPNIIIDGTEAWDEDLWSTLSFPDGGGKVILTAHCARCTSVNVDLENGKMGDGESGQLLKMMMKDRRVDPGSKWSPVFGRYGFPIKEARVCVGDEVVVERKGEKRVWNGLVPRLKTFDSTPTSFMPSFQYRLAFYIMIIGLLLAVVRMREQGYNFHSWPIGKHSVG